ncbi:hypothetical protein JOQ06_020414, partial [Pogonophryne albipinna]
GCALTTDPTPACGDQRGSHSSVTDRPWGSDTCTALPFDNRRQRRPRVGFLMTHLYKSPTAPSRVTGVKNSMHWEGNAPGIIQGLLGHDQ